MLAWGCDGGTVAPGDVVELAGPADSNVEPESSAPGDGAWGWISVIETNDLWENPYVMSQGWYGGLRAYFAARASWPRALPFDLGYAEKVSTEGACTLYDAGVFGEGCEDCFCLDKGIECNVGPEERWCGPDEMCVQGPEDPRTWPDRGVCQALPPHFDVGTITVEGLKLGVALNPDPYDRYMPSGLPDAPDLFDRGDAVTARTGGGTLPPLTLSAAGVSHLETVEGGVVHVRAGQPSIVKWNAADPEARILVVLRSGSHDPYPVSGAIVCDVEDAAGQVEVAAALLEKLTRLGCDGSYMMKSHIIYRYRRAVTTVADGAVELFVASGRRLQLFFD
jgi:hypothetical protein